MLEIASAAIRNGIGFDFGATASRRREVEPSAPMMIAGPTPKRRESLFASECADEVADARDD